MKYKKEICGRCYKNPLIGTENICHDCRVRSSYKCRVRELRKQRRIANSINAMKPEILKELHAELLAEILEEEKL